MNEKEVLRKPQSKQGILHLSKLNKKGISPVVATTLLISLVIILGVIIYLWARSVVPEALEKRGEPIERACEQVAFTASYGGGQLSITNNGDIPIQELEVSRKSFGASETITTLSEGVIKSGESRDFSISLEESGTGEYLIIPIILGETKAGERKTFACSSQYSQTIEITAETSE